mmetsp:Transcript_54179/g.144440  ORF Transcript_54179/g.144440 Transcript_54179/m.144440 type:complete len:262 (-) Transcript_54179:1168-1953(-)
MHSPGCQSPTLQSLISSLPLPLCLDSMVITSCFSFLDPHTVLRRLFSSLSQSLDCFHADLRRSRPSFSMAAMETWELDLSALPWASILAPSFFFAFMVAICVSSSVICFLHSLRVVDSRNCTCCFSACSSATIISSLSRNCWQFGLLATVQKNFALCLALLFSMFWNGNVMFVRFGADRKPSSAACTRASSLLAWSRAAWLIHPLGGASASLVSLSEAVDSASILAMACDTAASISASYCVGWYGSSSTPLSSSKSPSSKK